MLHYLLTIFHIGAVFVLTDAADSADMDGNSSELHALKFTAYKNTFSYLIIVWISEFTLCCLGNGRQILLTDTNGGKRSPF